jgi:hypothetical protein
MSTEPVSARSRPAMMRRRVDLPHPEGPKIKKNSPELISSDTSFKTAVGPKFFEMARRERELTRWV